MVLLRTVKHGMGYVRSETYFAIFYFCRNYNTKHNGALVLNTGIENRTEEIAASQNYTNIRFFRVGKLTSDKQENDLIGERDGWTEWASPATDDGDMLMDFSAICFLTICISLWLNLDPAPAPSFTFSKRSTAVSISSESSPKIRIR